MLFLVLILLVLFWILGYIQIPGLPLVAIPLFEINGRTITLWDFFIFFIVLWAIGILPHPLREIAGALLFLWVLAVLGFIAIANFSTLVIFAIIIGIILHLLKIV